MHTVYGGAHLFTARTAVKLGELARSALAEHAPDAFTFARALELPGCHELALPAADRRRLVQRFARAPQTLRASEPAAWLALAIHGRVQDKLQREPVEDYRIDFEDGYGVRSDAEEDADAQRVAVEIAQGLEQGTLPPSIGIRIKPLSGASRPRAERTLELVLHTLAAQPGGRIPGPFLVTLPKVTAVGQVGDLTRLLQRHEQTLGLSVGTLRLELMIEAPQVIVDPHGRCTLPVLRDAAEGRCAAAHFGPYDYTAACGIAAAHQTLDHPLCDFARATMLNAFAGTGVFLADGPTNVLPIGPHRAPARKKTARSSASARLTRAQQRENTAAVHHAWRSSSHNIRHALTTGFYQGWDLHPAQLPARFGVTYAFFLEGLSAAAGRLRNLLDAQVQATRVGAAFDDAATGRGLSGFLRRALECGAVTVEELAAAGIGEDRLA